MTRAPVPGAPDDAIECVTLGNSLTALVRRDPSAPVVAIVTHVRAGYFDEPDEVTGVSHVLEHMYFKGTPTRGPGEIARDTKAAGGYLNAGTTYDQTTYYTVLPASGLVTGLEVQADAYANSLIDADELAREIEVIVEEERRKRDTPSAVAIETCYAVLHDRHRMRRWRMGTPEQLRSLTRDHVFAFYRAHYVPSNTVLCIVGDVDVAEALRHVERLYGPLPSGNAPRDRGPAEPGRREFRWRDLERDVTQSRAVLGWRTVPPHHADTPALDVASDILASGRASRLYRNVRERSLATSVGTYHYNPTELGVFAAAVEAESAGLSDALRATFSEIRDLAGTPPREEELARVRRGTETRHLRRLEMMENQATFLAYWQSVGDWRLGGEYIEKLLAVQAADVQRACAEYLTLDSAALVTMRSPNTVPIADAQETVEALLRDSPRAAALPAPPVLHTPPLRTSPVTSRKTVHGVRIYETEGGVPVLVHRKPGVHIARIQITCTGGAGHEDERTAGRTTLMTRTSLKGTHRFDAAALSEAIESLGAAIGSGVGTEAFTWSLSAPSSRFDDALSLLAEVVQTPSFRDDALETERTIALQQLDRLRDDMSGHPSRLALAAAFGGHPYGRPSLGTRTGLASCDSASLREVHRVSVLEGHAVIGVVADLDEDDVAAAACAAFGSMRQRDRLATPHVEWPHARLESVESRDRAQTAITVMFPGPRRDMRQRRAAGLLGTVASGLGGRFFQTLRDREALAYTVNLGARALPRAGWIAAYLACAPAKEGLAREGLMRECLRLASEPVSDEELQRAKAYALGSLAIRQQNPASVLGDIMDSWVFGSLDELVDDAREVAALTAEDLLAVARESFDVSRAVWGGVRGRSEDQSPR